MLLLVDFNVTRVSMQPLYQGAESDAESRMACPLVGCGIT